MQISKRPQPLFKRGLWLTASLWLVGGYAVSGHADNVLPPPQKPADYIVEITPLAALAAEKPVKTTATTSPAAESLNDLADDSTPLGTTATILPIHKPQIKSTAITAAQTIEDAADYNSASEMVQSENGLIPLPLKRPLSNGLNGLSEQDAERYRLIFQHQQNGEWDKADELISELDDYFLRGHVLYQRYMHPAAYRSSFQELKNWMNLYADLPGSAKIYKLALSRKPSDYKGTIRKPVLKRVLQGVHPDLRDIQAFSSYTAIDSGRSSSSRAKIQDIALKVEKLLERGGPTAALKTINAPYNRDALSAYEYAQLKAQIAGSYLHLGYWEDAKKNALESIALSHGQAALAGWIAGLIHWKDGEYGPAAAYFERAALSAEASPWTISAGGYWAARAHMRTGNFAEVNKWLEIAARYQRTFYGILATKAMGRSYDFNWEVPSLTPAMQRKLMAKKGALRAMALMQAGQVHKAEEELKYIHPNNDKQLQEALIAYAYNAHLPAYQMRFASIFKSDYDHFYDAALFPIAPWQKQRKTNRGSIDKAVLNAFIRQESRFRSGAENPSGATGLMQLMPSTANYVMGTERFEGAGRERLKDPQLNMQIGETYIYNLLKQDGIDNDLFSLAIAYNAGPGNLRRWKEQRSMQGHDVLNDPLFFIETFPMSETRSFVERVMTNIWIYRMRLNQPTPSLDAVAQGHWPIYIAMDEENAPNYAFISSQENL